MKTELKEFMKNWQSSYELIREDYSPCYNKDYTIVTIVPVNNVYPQYLSGFLIEKILKIMSEGLRLLIEVKDNVPVIVIL